MGGVPRVSGLGAVAGRPHHGEFAHGELAEHGSTGFAEAFGDGGVGIGDTVIKSEAAVGSADAPGVAEVFKGYGNTVEGAAGIARGELAVGVLGLLKGEVGGGGEEGVEGVVEGVNSLDMGLSQLYRRKLAILDEL